MAAILYTSQVSHTRRFEGESPLSSLKLLQDRRVHNNDAIVISDDESGAIHEESDVEDDECACANDPESASILTRSCSKSAEDKDGSEPEVGDNLLQTQAEILSNGNGVLPGSDCFGTSGAVHPSRGQCGDWAADCPKAQTTHRANSHNWNNNSNPRIIIDDFGMDKHTNQIGMTPRCLVSGMDSVAGDSLERVASRLPNTPCNMADADRIMYL
jgi:hypothetical protein